MGATHSLKSRSLSPTSRLRIPVVSFIVSNSTARIASERTVGTHGVFHRSELIWISDRTGWVTRIMRQQSQRSDKIIVIAFDREIEDFPAPLELNSEDGCPIAVRALE